MIRGTILAITTAIILAGAAAAHVPTSSATKADTTEQHGVSYKPHFKPAYVKGSIAKHCLENQGECALVVR